MRLTIVQAWVGLGRCAAQVAGTQQLRWFKKMSDCGCVVPAGDDPNYWMWVTREAHAEYMTKKVRKLLAEVNEPGSNEVGATRLPGLVLSLSLALPTQPERTSLIWCEDQSRVSTVTAVTMCVSVCALACVLQPSGGGGQQPPPPEVCTSPQPTERASTSTGRPGWLGSVTDKMSRLAQRMSRTNLFSRSSDSYKPYTNEVSPHNSPAALSPDGSEHRLAMHGQWPHAAGTLRMTAAGLASSSVGSDGSVGNSKDSLDGNGSGHGTAAGSESGGSNAGGVVSGGGKRWSSGSSSGAGMGALGSSEGGSVATGSSRGGADNSSGSESSGGGATAAIDSIGRRLRLSGSRGSKGSGRGSSQQAAPNPAAAAGGAGPGTPPTYQTISELHSMTQVRPSHSAASSACKLPCLLCMQCLLGCLMRSCAVGMCQQPEQTHAEGVQCGCLPLPLNVSLLAGCQQWLAWSLLAPCAQAHAHHHRGLSGVQA